MPECFFDFGFVHCVHIRLFSILNLFDLTLRLNGFPIRKARLELEDILAIPESDYEDHLFKTKWNLVKFHQAHNPFYRAFAKHIETGDWNSVPIMTKRDLQQPLADRLSNGFNEKNDYINKTSGSSGDPFIFAKANYCHALTWAEIQHRFGWLGLDFNTSLQARFYGITLDKKGYYKERLKDVFSKRKRFSVFDLSDTAFEGVLESFKKHRFDYINGYTSPIVQLAKYLERKQVVLKSVCPTLKCCVVTSEMLFDMDKALMETYFGVPIVNEYGASELDLIAF